MKRILPILFSLLPLLSLGQSMKISPKQIESGLNGQVIITRSGVNVLDSLKWADLSDKPIIPTNNNQLTNGSGYLTVETDPVYTANKPNILAKINFPTNQDFNQSLLGISFTSVGGTFTNMPSWWPANDGVIAALTSSNSRSIYISAPGDGATLARRPEIKWGTLPAASSAWYKLAFLNDIPTTLPPSGAAGGDLSGTYPNPNVAKLNGQLPSYYLNYNNLTNQPTIPAQVNLTGSGATTVTGTYPNLTIGSTNTIYTAGTGLSLTGTTFTNTAPDQTVTMTNGTGISVTGTYPNFTITNTAPNVPYTLPIASATVLGGVMVGSGLSISSGVLSATNTTTGTVTSVALSVPTGLTISGSPITSSGTLAIGLATGYSIPTIANQTIWTNKQDALGTSTGGKYLYQDQTWKQIQYSEIAGTPTIPTITAGNQISITGSNNTIAFAPGGTTSQFILGDGSLMTLPAIGNATLTMNTTGIATGSQTFTANATSGKTFTVNVPGTNLGGSFNAANGNLTVTSSTGSTANIGLLPLSSGVYNPTIIDTINLLNQPVIALPLMYSQVGNIVTVSGTISNIQLRTAGTTSGLIISLPISTTESQSTGTMNANKYLTNFYGFIQDGTTNARLTFSTTDNTTPFDIYFTFQYRIQ